MFLCDVPPYSAECLFDWCELGQFLYETSSSWAICERWKVASFMAALCLHLPGMACSCHSNGEGHDRSEQQGSQLGGFMSRNGCGDYQGYCAFWRPCKQEWWSQLRKRFQIVIVDIKRWSNWRLRLGLEIEWHRFQNMHPRVGVIEGTGVMWLGVVGLQLPL